MQSSLKLGYILKYNPKTVTADIKSFDGATYTDVSLSSSLAVFATPVLPVTSGNKLVKSGSIVLYIKDTDTDVLIIKLLNDDLDISVNDSEPSIRPFNGELSDPALGLLEDGELLLQSPGVIDPQLLQRVPGALIVLKNDGQMLLSNSNNSASIYFDDNSKINISCIAVDINGKSTRMYEDDDGTLHLESLVENASVSKIDLNLDGTLSIESNSAMSIEGSSVNINSGTKGAARVDDEVKSTSVEDSAFWLNLQQLYLLLASHVHISAAPGSPSSIAATLAVIQAPTTLTGKITKGSEDVKIGGEST